MTRPVLVLSAGGHAKVLIDTLLVAATPIAGILDADPALAAVKVLGIPVLGDDDLAKDFPPDRFLLVNGIGSVGKVNRRQSLFEKFKAQGYCFAKVIHPSAVIAADVELGEGAQVMAGTVIQPGSRIGCNVIINSKTSIDHDCVIGNHVHVAPGVTLSGGVTIGKGTHISTGAVVIQGIAIGENALVAAGAVVVRDVKDGETVMGVPARVSVS
jgi:sugar O-acyltransferase (sialic acid O-acetyltransferase NeuD family)